MDRKNLYIFISLAVIVAIAGSVYVFMSQKSVKEETDEYIREETVGGKYECNIAIRGMDPRGFEFGPLTYVKEGAEHQGYYNSYLKGALDWIKSNTAEDTVFLNWWDYGHMIVGYAERESVIKNPSEEALESVASPSLIKEFDSHESLVDVAKALTTIDENEAISIMRKYGATYILITVEDGGSKAKWIFRYAELDLNNYTKADESMEWTFNPDQYNELGTKTIIYKILSNAEIEGLMPVYSDDSVKIYKLKK